MPHLKTFLHTSTHKSATVYRHSHSASRKIDMTEGPIFSKMLIFVLPLIATNLLQVFYNAADMVVVSLSHEPDAVGAIGVTGSFINLVINIFMGFATGANVIVARSLGAKDDKMASRAVHTAVSISLIFGIISGILGLFISRPILGIMGAEGKLLDLATTYTNIYFVGVPFIAFTNYLIAIFRAKGDTRTPLYVLSFSGFCNVLMNLFFVLVVGLSVEGVAIATTAANVISAVILCIKLSRDDTPCRFSFKKLCIDLGAFKRMLAIGLPAGIQGSLFSLSNMVIQSSILEVNNLLAPVGSAFEPVVKGNAAMANIESFVYTAQNTVYQSAITFTSQNVGAEKYDRVYKIRRYCYLLAPAIALILSALVFIFHQPLLAFYGVKEGIAGSLQHIAYETAFKRMLFITVPYFTICFMEIGSGVVRGLGKSLSSTVISLLGACAFRVLWIETVFRMVGTLESIYISYVISWLITGTVFYIYSSGIIKRNIKLMVKAKT